MENKIENILLINPKLLSRRVTTVIFFVISVLLFLLNYIKIPEYEEFNAFVHYENDTSGIFDKQVNVNEGIYIIRIIHNNQNYFDFKKGQKLLIVWSNDKNRKNYINIGRTEEIIHINKSEYILAIKIIGAQSVSKINSPNIQHAQVFVKVNEIKLYYLIINAFKRKIVKF